jgi:hypothetical protein
MRGDATRYTTIAGAASGGSERFAQRVTISLAIKSPKFQELAGEAGVRALQKVKDNGYKMEILSRRDLLLVKDALEQVDPVLPNEFVFANRCIDNRQSTGICDLCGQQHIRFLFVLKNRYGEESFRSVGSECIVTYLWNALGVASSEEADKILRQYINRAITIAQAEEFQATYPDFEQQLTDLNRRLADHTRFLRRGDIVGIARECERTLHGKRGGFLTHKKNYGIGFVSELRVDQVLNVWPKKLQQSIEAVTEYRRKMEEAAAQREEAERQRSVSVYEKILNEKQALMLPDEITFVQGLLDERKVLNKLPWEERNKVWNLHNRTEVPHPADTMTEQDWNEVRELLKECAQHQDVLPSVRYFAKDLLGYLERNKKLTPAQLPYVLGDANGLNPKNRPAIKHLLRGQKTVAA